MQEFTLIIQTNTKKEARDVLNRLGMNVLKA